jgi:hypothetical protein
MAQGGRRNRCLNVNIALPFADTYPAVACSRAAFARRLSRAAR